MERRDFLKVVSATAAVPAAAGGLLGMPGASRGAEPAAPWELPRPEETVEGGMRYRPLGRTGVRVSALGLGGYHVGTQKDEGESVKILRTAIDNGVTFLDNCWDYNGGASEERMGKA